MAKVNHNINMSYTLIRQINSQSAQIEFKGLFNEQPVTWNTHFFTFKGYRSQQNMKVSSITQFIEIKASKSDVMELTVVLDISEINPPNIKKMMIMINLYKNLSIGRHEYGT